MKRFNELLDEYEIQLLSKYLELKIKLFRNLMKELEDVDIDYKTDDELKNRKALIKQYGHDIVYYEQLKGKVEKGGGASHTDALELWCMCDNKENFDKVHNDLHKTIIAKLKEYQFKSKSAN